MKILISGGSGFIGRALCKSLTGHHEITVKIRKSVPEQPNIRLIKSFDELNSTEVFDVAINLAGEPIADKRWTNGQRQKIIASRLDTTEEFISYFKRIINRPKLFISGSAIGYYGIKVGDEPVDENISGDDSFSSGLCERWEKSALQAESLGIRTCLLRTGIVLGKGGGALAKMLPPFRLGLGGNIGKGSQWMPWIHITDLIGIINHCITDETLHGPINCTAPNPVTNSEFTKALGKALSRPTLLTVPSLVISTIMGDMGKELLLAGRKVVPVKALETGYKYRYSHLDSALANILEQMN